MTDKPTYKEMEQIICGDLVADLQAQVSQLQSEQNGKKYNMLDYLEFANKLRAVADLADAFRLDRKSILDELLLVAELYETKAEKIEMEMVESCK